MKKFARTKTGIFFSTKNVSEEHFNELDSTGLLDRKADCITALLMEGDLVEYRIKKNNGLYDYGCCIWQSKIQCVPIEAEMIKIYVRYNLEWVLRAWINPRTDNWDIFREEWKQWK